MGCQKLSGRISVTLRDSLCQALLRRSEREGRSLSNLIAFLLEQAIADSQGVPNHLPPPPAVCRLPGVLRFRSKR